MNQLQQDIARLLAIQGQECRLLALEDDKERIPRMLEETRARIMRAEESLKAARGELKGIQVKKKELDLESESKLEAVAKYQKQQFDVKTNAEYQALEREIAERKVENARIEDRILEVMEAVEERERLVKAGDEAVKREKEALAAEEVKVGGELAKLGGQIAALAAERDVLLPGITPAVLKKYQRIFKNKRGNAVVPLVDYTCGGCHMQLPPQIANNVRKHNELVICENCSRILYWEDGLKKDEAAQPVSQESAG